MKKLFLYLLLVVYATSGSAQDRLSFHSQNYLGVLQGHNLAALQVQTINGLQKKVWFGGIGLGIDYYRMKSVPLFLNVTKFLFQKQELFVTGSGGINFYWDEKLQTTMWGSEVKGPARGFYEAGIGGRLAVNKTQSLLLTAGYSYKKITEKTPTRAFCPGGDCRLVYDVYDYNYRRLSFKLGFMF